MSIEKNLERIANSLETLVDLQIKQVPDEKIKEVSDKNIKEADFEVVKEKLVENKADDIFGNPVKTKPEKKVKSEKKAKPKKVKKVKPEVKKTATLSKKLTMEDVIREGRLLVDGFKTNRKGFEKAKLILNKLGTTSLKDLASSNFAEAINEFRKAVKKFGG